MSRTKISREVRCQILSGVIDSGYEGEAVIRAADDPGRFLYFSGLDEDDLLRAVVVLGTLPDDGDEDDIRGAWGDRDPGDLRWKLIDSLADAGRSPADVITALER